MHSTVIGTIFCSDASVMSKKKWNVTQAGLGGYRSALDEANKQVLTPTNGPDDKSGRRRGTDRIPTVSPRDELYMETRLLV